MTAYSPTTHSFGSVDFTPLTGDTSPDAIGEVQRADVQSAWNLGLHDVHEISVYTALPLWSVRRRLGELGLGPVTGFVPCEKRVGPPNTSTRSKEQTRDRVVKALCDGPKTVKQLIAATGMAIGTVREVLKDARFKVKCTIPSGTSQPEKVWGLGRKGARPATNGCPE